jgi:hypothetical protein
MKKIKDMTVGEYSAMKKHPKFNELYPFATGDYIKDKVRCSKGFINFNPRIKRGDYVIEIGNWFTRTFLPKEMFKVTYVSDYSPIIEIKSTIKDWNKKVLMGAVRLATPKEIEKMSKKKMY